MNDEELLAQLQATFFEEANEAIDAMEQCLLRLEQPEPPFDLIHTMFRAAHSLKGGGGAVGLSELSGPTHELETCLDAFRREERFPSESEVSDLLARVDRLRGQVRALAGTGTADSATATGSSGVPPAPADEEAQTAAPGVPATPPAPPETKAPASEGAATSPTLSFHWAPQADVMRTGIDPVLLLRELGEIAPLRVRLDASRVPPLDELSPQSLYLAWDIEFHGPVDLEQVQEVFSWLEPESQPALAGATSTDNPETESLAAEESESSTVPLDSKEASAPAPDAVPTAPTVVERDDDTLMIFSEFFDDASDGLSEAEQALSEFSAGIAAEDATTDRLFRVFHTIKGIAGFLELTDIQEVAHESESLFQKVQDGIVALTTAIDVAFSSVDTIRLLVDQVRLAVERSLSIPRDRNLQVVINQIHAAMTPGGTSRPQPQRTTAPPMSTEVATPTNPAPADPSPPPSAVAPAPAEPEPPVSTAPSDVPAPPPNAPPKTEAAPSARAKLKETLKVDVDRVDRLVEMIGELVIVESMIGHAPELASIGSANLRNQLDQLAKISRNLQDAGMQMRMVPLSGVFRKMSRMARDLAQKSGKKIQFHTEGENTEIDRSMVEKISDPLMHMLRNSADHGIESAEERKRAGKTEHGTIHLGAYQEGNQVVIELSDDGRGLNRNAIIEKAKKVGLIRDSDGISDADIYALIFSPGFSTAKRVTEISGRGVGMDVVKKNVEALRGKITIDSTPGRGTTFRLVFPLTLAIIEGTLVAAQHERYIIPTLSIIETLQPHESHLRSFATQGALLQFRDETIPLFRFADICEVPGDAAAPEESIILILESMGSRFAMMVDQVLEHQQIVIKSLGPGLQNLRMFSGAAILSDGSVGLILNIDELRAEADRNHRGAAPAGFLSFGSEGPTDGAAAQEVSP